MADEQPVLSERRRMYGVMPTTIEEALQLAQERTTE